MQALRSMPQPEHTAPVPHLCQPVAPDSDSLLGAPLPYLCQPVVPDSVCFFWGFLGDPFLVDVMQPPRSQIYHLLPTLGCLTASFQDQNLSHCQASRAQIWEAVFTASIHSQSLPPLQLPYEGSFK